MNRNWWLLELAREPAPERDYAAELRREKMDNANLRIQIEQLTAALRESQRLTANRTVDYIRAAGELKRFKQVLAVLAARE